ncbi:hypothetical protein [Pedobacter punctiformis]|uniref:Uncharacterized protein n=1 Tax=Pedobacter punctiformis TaxID=3004097 RepID=A0ABT4L394_9SPHI|nr:hypothetical protein [Pedobacter sp. HCMS5-2]MCZ4242397.1 hypothetical protein [Pedobacter sp. HCMS5-2]
MYNKVVVINTFEPGDFQIDHFAKAYDNGVAESGNLSELFFTGNMLFSATPFPEKYTFETLETDLKQLVIAIKNASTIIFFTNYKPDRTNHQLKNLISRLFHITQGSINREIWGDFNSFHKQQVRIITYMDDLKTSIEYKAARDPQKFPIQKVPFRFFGFGRIRAIHIRCILEKGFSKTTLKEMALLHEFGRQDAGLVPNKPSSEKMKLMFDVKESRDEETGNVTIRKRRIRIK